MDITRKQSMTNFPANISYPKKCLFFRKFGVSGVPTQDIIRRVRRDFILKLDKILFVILTA